MCMLHAYRHRLQSAWIHVHICTLTHRASVQAHTSRNKDVHIHSTFIHTCILMLCCLAQACTHICRFSLSHTHSVNAPAQIYSRCTSTCTNTSSPEHSTFLSSRAYTVARLPALQSDLAMGVKPPAVKWLLASHCLDCMCRSGWAVILWWLTTSMQERGIADVYGAEEGRSAPHVHASEGQASPSSQSISHCRSDFFQVWGGLLLPAASRALSYYLDKYKYISPQTLSNASSN